jgi:hypothetical protein
MKTIFLGLLLIFSVSFSQTGYLNVSLNNGNTISISIEEITKITFDSLLTDIHSLKKFQNVIKVFTLFQNYPNPFNATTTISYRIPSPGTVNIKIFNIAGQLTRKIERQHDSSGAYSTQWDGKNGNSELVSSGLYIFQASFGNQIISKKMIVVK